ncbi:MAG: restriction endonuclease subunit S, partial [Cetobacterium sp.]
LPPLEEQERIVKKLDSMLGRINEAKELIAQAKETFENRRASILNLAFSGELTKKWRESNSIESSKILLENLNKEKIRLWEEECEKALGEGKKKPSKPKLLSMDEMLIPKEEQPYKVPKSWEWVKLGNIANKITDGSHNPPKSKKTGIPMLSAKNIKNNDLDFSNIDRLITDEEFEKENNRTNIKAGDILLTIVGTIGRTCEVKQNFPKFALQRSVAVISTYINNNYLKLAFNSKFLKDSMMKRAKGTAQLGIYLNNLKELNIPLPPLEEQKEIVRILDNVLEKEEKINEILELEEMIELLEKSILDKAFRGELGTGNLEDVPSLEVLKNILEK